MKKAYAVSLVVALVGAVVSFGLVGCEDGAKSEMSLLVGVPDITQDGKILYINPTLNTSNAEENAVVFVAKLSDTNDVIAYPLEWTVSDTTLGNIHGKGGDTAIYTRTNLRGSNVIKARDAQRREGVAVVTQY